MRGTEKPHVVFYKTKSLVLDEHDVYQFSEKPNTRRRYVKKLGTPPLANPLPPKNQLSFAIGEALDRPLLSLSLALTVHKFSNLKIL
jgi:hypothetical protein